jgi:hypothetical protein
MPRGLRHNTDPGDPVDPRYNITSYKTQRLPRSADPSPQRTVKRIESLGERHGGKKQLLVF